jgi:hypothetical protein
MLNKQKKVNVSINPETMKLLIEERDRLAKILGFVPSLSQVIQHIVTQINKPT